MNFIEFNNKKIHFTKKNGTYYIIVKSVCEALDVDFEMQRRRIKEDPILGPAPLNSTVQVDGDTQKRTYFCLPEKYIYGWIFSIQSNSEELLAYKRECYDVLFNHFNGIITKQAKIYTEITKEKRALTKLEATLSSNAEYNEYQDTKMRLARLWKNIREASNDPELFEDEQ